MSKYKELVKKLKEIFQIDRPELDFGIYRILNAKADEINDYLENTLKKKIGDALATAGNANKEELEKQLSLAIKGAEDAGFNSDDSPKVKDLRLQISATSTGANEHENAVFTHLLSFFSRYYDSGDFVSKRRYKGDTYAIPYAGEEVMLHWANKDQYYIKSGENFANYSFKLDDGRKVSFKLLAADTAKDNRKDNDADRRFVLIEPHIRTKFDEEGYEYEEEYQPVSVIKSDDTEELVIQFEYKSVKKGTKQEALVLEALQSVLTNEQVQSDWVDITNREPTEKKPNRTLLEKHLTTYTQRNTADYFIHKNLGGFLSNELDFYIKNEVMNLDNVQNAEVFADIEKQLRMIQCLRSIASDVITFLAQLENFQKKLWTKKKFIVETNYNISLDRVPLELYPMFVKNQKQWEQWVKLGFIESTDVKSIEFLKENNGLLIDTQLYDVEQKNTILARIENIDDNIDGLLVSSDNYQALSLLDKQFQGKINTIYIDPPYNTDAGPILYKNGFRDSSWISLMETRLELGKKMLSKKGIICCTIDDYELYNLAKLMEEVFYEIAGTVAIRIKPSGRPIPNGFALAHEYALFAKKDENTPIERLDRTAEQLARYRDSDDKSPYFWEMLRKAGGGASQKDRPTMCYPFLLAEDGSISLAQCSYNAQTEQYENISAPEDNEKLVWPERDDNSMGRWYLSKDRVANMLTELKAVKQDNGKYFIYYRRRPNEGVQPLSFWADAKYSATEHGTALIKKLFGNSNVFSYPKSIHAVEDCLKVGGAKEKNSIVLDYFAGSGTTGHAVINLNRSDNGNRKFILVEQGEYFNEVTKPRVLKNAYSSKWLNGKAQDNDSMSMILKTVVLESYEDTLNNLELKKPQQQLKLLEELPSDAKSDYLINYMLETESKGSLLSTDDFKKPFDYKMKIAVDSSGASEEQNIDLVETFNYLIGLHVNTIESNIERGYVRIEGELPSGERALVLWRDCEKIQYNDFTKFASRFDLFAKQKTFDVIYVNGDHNLPTAFTNDEDEVTRTLKLRQIEPEFLEQMFAPDELA